MAQRGCLALALVLVTVFSVCDARSEKLLVLVDSPELQETHSLFLSDLETLGLEVDVKPIDDGSLRLQLWDEWLYDKIVVLGGTKELGGSLDVSLLAAFVDAKHDLVLALAPEPAAEMRELATALGVDLDAPGRRVLDHTAYDGALGGTTHDVVLADDADLNRHVFPRSLGGPVLFAGTGVSVPPTSEFSFLALRARPTGYAGVPGEPLEKPGPTGRNLGLVGLLQARNNARAAVLASLSMLSDAFFEATVTDADGNSLGLSGNRAAALGIVRWALSLQSVLRVSDVSHRVVGGAVRPERYRINDPVEFAVHIDELVDGEWKPFDADDVQVELVMLDPYIRQTAQHNGKGAFTVRTQAPDVYGVFKWILEYARPGLSRLSVVETVPIRPFAHNEYERFILQAFPYYGAIFTLMAAFLVTGVAFVYTK